MKKIVGILVMMLLIATHLSTAGNVKSELISEEEDSIQWSETEENNYVHEEILIGREKTGLVKIYNTISFQEGTFLGRFEGINEIGITCGKIISKEWDSIIIGHPQLGNDPRFLGSAEVFSNDCNSIFTDMINWDKISRMTCGDVDGDEKDEFIFIYHSEDFSHICIRDVYQNFEFIFKKGTKPVEVDWQELDELACGDIDKDGFDEILHAYYKTGIVVAYRKDGTSNIAIDVGFAYGDQLACGDVNGDGTDEILIAHAKDKKITIWDQYETPLQTLDNLPINNYQSCGFDTGRFYCRDRDDIVIGEPGGHVYIFDFDGKIVKELKDIDFNLGDDLVCGDFKNSPPRKPDTPSGPSKGKVLDRLEYSTKTLDPDEETCELFYTFYWGESPNTVGLGPYKSGETVKTKRQYIKEGDKKIQVQAWNCHQLLSPMSDPKNVHIPRNIASPSHLILLNRLFERIPNMFPIIRELRELINFYWRCKL